ncbi:MAG: polysaccharide deacetylase family protein [Alphaproteobacteria bacterium]|nr:polysaccharide deacetylase family protein [Alphaproteobacteria bacterium]
MAALIVAVMFFGGCAHLNPAGRTVAMTFDDLPMTNPERDAQPLAIAAETNRQILAALERYRAPATGFVNEIHITSIGPGADQLLTGWNQGEYELANHGATHADANVLDLPAIEREIIQGETTIGPLVRNAGRSLRFFRFPYNHLGETAEKQTGAMALLKARGYQLAASTIDTSDYVFDKAFVRALDARDSDMQSRIKRAYLDHTAKQIAYYAGLNLQVLGYEPPAIMLLHINRLNAETLDAQLALFRKAGYRFVSLAEAQADPAYAQAPRLPTRFGPMWCYRWARDRGIRVDGRLEEEPPAWVADYGAAISVESPAPIPRR